MKVTCLSFVMTEFNRAVHPDIHEAVTLAVSDYVPPNEAGHEYVKHAEEREPEWV